MNRPTQRGGRKTPQGPIKWANMYSINQLWTGVKNPELALSKLNGTINHWRVGSEYYPRGVDVFEEDWDNLVILDACRYDFFDEQVWFEGTTEKRLSRGSTSREFIRGNFTDRTAKDTVYVSANPWYLRLHDTIGGEVHDYMNLHSDEKRDAVGGLTTRPETVTKHALEANEAYPNKRIIFHYLQPHQPYLTDFGREIVDYQRDMMLSIKQSDADRAEIVKAYRENLDLVLDEVETLIESLTGKTVITADHGELLGERERPIPVRRFGHPGGVYVDELLEVPWHVIDTGERKEIVAEEPVERSVSESDQEAVEQQLADLGYRV
ncbi:hypothetical protein [Haloarcula salinisoli]|uniref:hypothetical protein n=1 Tax=Haloarcula salinisoli TaxID=2487746 RepID=UPI002E2A08C6|nr:hypothetical protein [Halomicroarcula salinisoli]